MDLMCPATGAKLDVAVVGLDRVGVELNGIPNCASNCIVFFDRIAACGHRVDGLEDTIAGRISALNILGCQTSEQVQCLLRLLSLLGTVSRLFDQNLLQNVKDRHQ